MVQGRAIFTMADRLMVSRIGAIFNDLERPNTQILRSHQYSTLNISLTLHDIFTMDRWTIVRLTTDVLLPLLEALLTAG